MTQGRQLRLEWAEEQGRTFLRVRGWTEIELRELGGLTVGDLGQRLALLPSEVLETVGDFRLIPPVAGGFTFECDSIYFVPRFPFVNVMSYSLLVDSGGGVESPEVWTIQRSSPASAPATGVVAIYPTAPELPVNLLRIYVHFSGPMSEGWAARTVRLHREDTGEVLEGAFLPPDPELWDPARRRLTMLLDPGRIKRGLIPNQEVGYPLIEGVPVRLVIGPEFRDASGQPLTVSAERSYRIGPAIRARINPGCWQLTVPEADSADPLIVKFDRSLDYALLQHSLLVCDSNGLPLQGQEEVGPAEESWRFMPAFPWIEGSYQLVIGPRLEDVAGNSPGRVFDRDITQAEDGQLSSVQVEDGRGVSTHQLGLDFRTKAL